MKRGKSFVTALCIVLMVLPATAQVAPDRQQMALEPQNWHTRFTRNYSPISVAPINIANSGRLDQLMRAGRIYLSLQDAIALAIENNLDIEIARYNPRISEADLLRARAGGAARNANTSVSTGPSSAGGSSTTGGVTSSSSLTGISTTTTGGPAAPSYDPAFTSTLQWGHTTAPQLNSFIAGTSAVVNEATTYNFGIAQGFITGAQAQLGFNNAFQKTTSPRTDLNPAYNSSLALQFSQPLLQGFGVALNNRFIRIAKNNLKVADYNFQQQLITTVNSVINLYWDLVSFNEDVIVKQKALALSQKLYEDNKKQVEIGTLAPIEIVRAEAEVAAREQDLTVSQTNLLQQETIIKNALSKTGIASPSVADARIVPIDRIRVPETEAIQPLQDLTATALASRPELRVTDVSLENSRISLKASRNSLLPSLNAVASLSNSGLSGDISSLPMPTTTPGALPIARNPNSVDGFFLGGFGQDLRQLFARNFPNYTVGVQLNIPIFNRSARADMISAQLQLRQNELRQQQQVNAVRVEVSNAVIGVQQARARFQAAVKARILAEQTLDAEQKKYALGASTIFLVIQAQRDLAQAQFNEVAAQAVYSRAHNEMDRATGQTLKTNNVLMDDAVKGTVQTPHSPLPVLDKP